MVASRCSGLAIARVDAGSALRRIPQLEKGNLAGARITNYLLDVMAHGEDVDDAWLSLVADYYLVERRRIERLLARQHEEDK
jgi:hypothetical protein